MSEGVLPNFLVIGAMKTGTGSLWSYLDAHPDVFMSKRKELHFFVEERNWGRGRNWYEEQFAAANGAKSVGEASTSYSMHPVLAGVPARIASMIPDVRIIYVVRHPVERMRSHYLENLYFDLEARERFWGPWERDPIRPEQLPVERALRENPLYLDTSRYAMQIEQYLEHFELEQLLVVSSEALRTRRREAVARVYRFLGLDDSFEPPSLEEEKNRTESKRPFRPAARKLARVPGYGLATALLPRTLKDRFRDQLKTRGVDPARAEISPELQAELTDRLRDDVRRLRDYAGEGFDGWGIA
jgi:hypothetical protein